VTAAIDRLERAGPVSRREPETSARREALPVDVDPADLDGMTRALQRLASGPSTRSAPIAGSCILIRLPPTCRRCTRP
jgi:hypothetical protein